MNKKISIRDEIKEMVDHVSAEWLSDILEFVKQFASKDEKACDITSFFGIWRDIDEELFNDLTINLHENRLEPNREF